MPVLKQCRKLLQALFVKFNIMHRRDGFKPFHQFRQGQDIALQTLLAHGHAESDIRGSEHNQIMNWPARKLVCSQKQAQICPVQAGLLAGIRHFTSLIIHMLLPDTVATKYYFTVFIFFRNGNNTHAIGQYNRIK